MRFRNVGTVNMRFRNVGTVNMRFRNVGTVNICMAALLKRIFFKNIATKTSVVVP